jgi:hypothetical protein
MWEKPRESGHLKNLSLDGRIVIKLILMKLGRK